MPHQIDDNQLDLVTEVAKVEAEKVEVTEVEPIDYRPHPGDDVGLVKQKTKPTGHIDYNGETDMMLQTGDRIYAYTLSGDKVEGYFDGTVRWNSENQEWVLQIRTGETDATDLSHYRFLQLLDQ